MSLMERAVIPELTGHRVIPCVNDILLVDFLSAEIILLCVYIGERWESVNTRLGDLTATLLWQFIGRPTDNMRPCH